MKRVLLLVAILLAPASEVVAQTIPIVLPTSVDILVIPETGDANTVAPVAARNTVIATLSNNVPQPNAKCGQPVTTAPTAPLVNPTTVDFQDPFNASRVCNADIPTGLAEGKYRVVAVFQAAQGCNPTGGVVTAPCFSTRSTIGVPSPFTVAARSLPPVPPTGVVVRP